jgi:hypothetical protein
VEEVAPQLSNLITLQSTLIAGESMLLLAILLILKLKTSPPRNLKKIANGQVIAGWQRVNFP